MMERSVLLCFKLSFFNSFLSRTCPLWQRCRAGSWGAPGLWQVVLKVRVPAAQPHPCMHASIAAHCWGM